MAVKIGCVVMAAGNARRFGENKLLEQWQGRSLIRRALDAVPMKELSEVVVVSRYPAVLEMAREYCFRAVENPCPDLGASHTVALGVQALSHCDGILFMVADQPMLRRSTVADLVGFFREEPERIAALAHEGQRGNPCLFPRRFFPELLALEGDRGGSAVIRRHPEALRLMECGAEELADVDTREDLAALGE